MSPPGKNSGLTTKRVGGEGQPAAVDRQHGAVVRAAAEAWPGGTSGVATKAGRNKPLDQVRASSRPPPPWANCTVAWSLSGTGNSDEVVHGRLHLDLRKAIAVSPHRYPLCSC